MSFIFTLEKFDVLKNFPDMKIFQTDYQYAEKNDLIKRVSALKNELPKNLRSLLEGICHPDFKVTIYDSVLLHELKKVSLFFAKHANFRPAEANQQAFWQTIAFNLDRLIQEKAAFPLLNLDSDILYELFSYLSLTDISTLIQVAYVKDTYLNPFVTSTRQIPPNLKIRKSHEGWTNLVQEVLINHPFLISSAPNSSHIQKARIYLKVSKECQKKQPIALSSLFSSLYAPTNERVRQHYLLELSDDQLFKNFLGYTCPTGKILTLEIPSKRSSKSPYACSLLQPISQSINYWNQLIKTFSDTEKLKITTLFNDDLLILEKQKPILEVINQLPNVLQLELEFYHFTQFVPVYSATRLESYNTFIHKFPQLTKLILIGKDISSNSKNIDNLQQRFPEAFETAYQNIYHLSFPIRKLLHPNLGIQSIQINLDYFPYLPLERFEDYHKQKRTLYPAYYLKCLMKAILHAFNLKFLSEMQLYIPKPPIVNTWEEIAPLLSPQFQALNLHTEMKILDDQMVFTFQKNPNPISLQ